MFPSPRSLLGKLVDGVARALPDRPPLVGARAVPGLRAPVDVVWTEGGLPHLTADNTADLFFAQGWLAAADRFFQMDMTRRTMRGELSAILGDRPAPWKQLTAVFEGASLPDVDHFLRQLSVVPVAAASLEQHSPDTRAILDAYAKGVNAWLASSPRPLECALLSYEPEPWRPIDSLLVLKGLAFQLSWGWRIGLFAEAVAHRFRDAPDQAAAFLPTEARVRAELANTSPIAGKLLEKLEGVFGGSGPANGGGGGSNAWAVAGSRTASGRPIVCGDPHLQLKAPAPGWLVHLQGGGYDVAGWSVPGVPGVFMGHNAHVAWSITNGAAHDATWAREELKTAEDGLRLVRTAEGWSPVRAESVSIAVKGRATPQQRMLAFTDNGPLFGGHLSGLDDDTGLALRWTGHLPSPDLDGLLDLNRAKDGDDVRAAVSKLSAPVINLVWADVSGHVGWRMAGAAPRFPGNSAPSGAVPGHDHAQDWQGLVPPEAMPAVVDPASGLVVSANDAPPEPSTVRGAIFHPPWRANRIRTLLGGGQGLTLEQVLAPQLDDESGYGLALRDRFIRPWRAAQMAGDLKSRPYGDALALVDLAAGWNGHADPGSPNAAATWAFAQSLLKRLFAEPLGSHLFASWTELYHMPLLPLLDVLAAEGAPFVARGGFDALVRGALDEAVALLRTRCGGGPSSWTLGAMRTLTITHTMSQVPGLGALFTLGPIPWGGDVSTLNMGSFRMDGDGAVEVGPVFRQGVEVGDWDGYRVVLATGQSGDPASARYRDHATRWQAGQWFTFPFSDRAIAHAMQFEGTLEPAPPAPEAR